MDERQNASHQAVIKDPDFFKVPGAPAPPGRSPIVRAEDSSASECCRLSPAVPSAWSSAASLGPHLAATHIPRRRILLDAGLLRADPGEFERILVHEIFHFAWVRLSNQTRRSWEGVLAAELAARARGELGWSSEWRKNKLTPRATSAAALPPGAATCAKASAIPPPGSAPDYAGMTNLRSPPGPAASAGAGLRSTCLTACPSWSKSRYNRSHAGPKTVGAIDPPLVAFCGCLGDPGLL